MNIFFSPKWGLFFLIIVWFCWGFSYPATKITLRGFDVWTSRLIIMAAGGFLLLYLAKLNKEQKAKLQEFADLCGDDVNPQSKSFFELSIDFLALK